MWFKSCSRCNGDLIEDSDGFGKYISCLACGHYLSSAEEVGLRFGSLKTVARPAGSATAQGTLAA